MGRKDSLTASKALANNIIPGPNSTIGNLVAKFQNVNLSLKDMVALSGTLNFPLLISCIVLDWKTKQDHHFALLVWQVHTQWGKPGAPPLLLAYKTPPTQIPLRRLWSSFSHCSSYAQYPTAAHWQTLTWQPQKRLITNTTLTYFLGRVCFHPIRIS